MQVGAFSFLDLTVKYTICNENCTVFITNRRCGYRQSIGIGGGYGRGKGEERPYPVRQGGLLGDWIEVLNDAGDELQLHPFLHLLVDTAE